MQWKNKGATLHIYKNGIKVKLVGTFLIFVHPFAFKQNAILHLFDLGFFSPKGKCPVYFENFFFYRKTDNQNKRTDACRNIFKQSHRTNSMQSIPRRIFLFFLLFVIFLSRIFMRSESFPWLFLVYLLYVTSSFMIYSDRQHMIKRLKAYSLKALCEQSTKGQFIDGIFNFSRRRINVWESTGKQAANY